MSLVKISFLLLLSSCSLLDILEPTSSSDVSTTKDSITEDVKYTSDKITKLNEARVPNITPAKDNQVSVINGIKLNPFIVKTKNDVVYNFLLSVIGTRGAVTNEMLFKCDGKEFISHKILASEVQGRNVAEHSLEIESKKTFYYQEELIETRVPVELFDYLSSCHGDILMRAKGIKISMDSSMLGLTNETKTLSDGMKELKLTANPILK